MSFEYRVGLRNVGSYQISGHPYLTGSTLATGQEAFISFPYVSREFTVIASGSTSGGPVLRVHFNSTSSLGGQVISRHHYVTLQKDDQAITFHTKCKGVYITCPEKGTNDNGYEIVASLTGIAASDMYELTGSGLTD